MYNLKIIFPNFEKNIFIMKDLLTGEEFEPKKISQKFSNSKNRIKYNNNKASKLRKDKAYIDKPLNNNLRILNELMKDKKESKFHNEFLLGKGFNFNLSTHIDIYMERKYYCIYQYLMITEKEHTKFIRNDRP
jgi:hypothetical protein